ncbi:MAG TPA: cytochrome c oxidase subunit 3 [Gaiellaceae bacterium]|nr:cytochrome c oxidase subunit 3 [Gaiellaceae bacterium]
MSSGDYIATGRPLSEIPRTTAATGSDVPRVLARRTGPPAAWWGMLMLVASESVLFGAFIGTFFYLRFNDPQWPPAGDPHPKILLPVIWALVLATTSPLMQLAWRAARRGSLMAVRSFIVVALAIQTAYFGWEVHDYHDELSAMPIGRDAYTSIHYVLLGADHAHVFAGLLFDLWLLWKFSRGITTYRANALQAITWYWHFVVILTLVVTAAITSAAVG